MMAARVRAITENQNQLNDNNALINCIEILTCNNQCVDGHAVVFVLLVGVSRPQTQTGQEGSKKVKQQSNNNEGSTAADVAWSRVIITLPSLSSSDHLLAPLDLLHPASASMPKGRGRGAQSLTHFSKRPSLQPSPWIQSEVEVAATIRITVMKQQVKAITCEWSDYESGNVMSLCPAS